MLRTSISLLSFLCLVGCGNADETSSVATSRAPVKNGTLDTETNSVLAVGHNIDGGVLCSAVLLTPDLVLTAWHCVSDMASVGHKPVCDGTNATKLPKAYPAAGMFVVDGADAYREGKPLRIVEVFGPPDETHLCGADIAVLRLQTPLLDRPSIAPRLNAPPVVGETVKVFGYGQREPLDAMSSGVRAFTTTTVDHVGEEIIEGRVIMTDNELSVTEGPCAGDSGGPLFDSDGRTIGVMSRGRQSTCEHMIYGRLDVRAEWLKELGRASAERLGQPAPEWAESKVESPADSGAEAEAPLPATATTTSSGCSTGHGGSALSAGVLMLAVAYLTRRRRRTRSELGLTVNAYFSATSREAPTRTTSKLL